MIARSGISDAPFTLVPQLQAVEDVNQVLLLVLQIDDRQSADLLSIFFILFSQKRLCFYRKGIEYAASQRRRETS